MNKKEFETIKSLEGSHWWYVGMKKIWTSLLKEIVPKNRLDNILDIGCGTGGNLKTLEKFGEAEGIEFDTNALEICKKNNLKCYQGSILDLSKVKKNYDLITIFDVLYQFDISTTKGIIKNLRDCLKDEGFLLIREPAFKLAYGRHDIEVGTKNRFEKKDFINIFEELGYNIKIITYLNFFLFIPILFKRKIGLLKSQEPESDLMESSKLENLVFGFFLKVEKEILLFSLKYFSSLVNYIFPFGLSVFMIVQKKNYE